MSIMRLVFFLLALVLLASRKADKWPPRELPLLVGLSG